MLTMDITNISNFFAILISKRQFCYILLYCVRVPIFVYSYFFSGYYFSYLHDNKHMECCLYHALSSTPLIVYLHVAVKVRWVRRKLKFNL